MEVHLYWAVGEEWGDGEEIFAATSEEQAVQEMKAYCGEDSKVIAQPLSEAELDRVVHARDDETLMSRRDALRLYLRDGAKVPFYFESNA
jgi:hypothetical protein